MKQTRLSDNDHLGAEERFASALQQAVRKRTSGPQMDSVLAEPRDMAPAYVDGGWKLTVIRVLAHYVPIPKGQYSGSPGSNFL